MGKITVKHYLNTKAKPHKIDSDKRTVEGLYPIYVQIIYKRFSTNKRSDTVIDTTINGFEHYKKTGQFLKNETLTLCSEVNLKNEIIRIENSIRLVEDYGLTHKKSSTIDIIDYFSKRVAECLVYQLIQEYQDKEIKYEIEESKIPDYYSFILAFNGKQNLIDNLKSIKKFTQIELDSFIKPEDIIKWESVKLLRDFFSNTSFAEFVYSDYRLKIKELLKAKTVEYYEGVIIEIEALMNNYINYQGYEKIIFPNYLY